MNDIWNHRIVRHDSDPNPENHWLGVHLVFYENGEQVSWNPVPETIRCSATVGREGIVGVLVNALKDVMDTDIEILNMSDMKQKRG